MRVGVVIPTFNRKQYLSATIASVQAQSVDDWQLVIVDDGSTDGTPEVARDFARTDPRIRLLSQPQGHISAARNRGLASIDASCEFVMFVDDDDVLEPHAMRVLMDALDEEPTAVAAYGLARTIDSEGLPLGDEAPAAIQTHRKGIRAGQLVDWPADRPTTFQVLAFCDVIPTPGQVLIRRWALDRAGLFRDPAEDWDMWLRLATYGDFLFIQRPLIGYRWHEGNFSRNVLLATRGKFTVHWRLLWSSSLTVSQRRDAWLGFIYYYSDISRTSRTLRRLFRRITAGIK